MEVFGFYNSSLNGNVSGGIHPNHATYVDDLYLGVKFDLEKLFGWRGGQFVVSGINRNGADLTSRYIGSAFSTQQCEGFLLVPNRTNRRQRILRYRATEG